MRFRLAAASLILLAATTARGADTMDMSANPSDSAATRDYKVGMAKMHAGMGHYTGDADRDFVVNMLPHHQGAVDMAKTELQYGKDPALKKLATDIIAAQDKEIAFMQDWLKKHPQ